MTPRRVKEKQPEYKSRPIPTAGWKSEQHYNHYVDQIINSKGFRSQPNAKKLEAEIRKFAEGGHWRSIAQLIGQSKGLGYGSEAMVMFKRMGGEDGPDGAWVQKGMSVLQEDGTYTKLPAEEVKTLRRIQNAYNKSEGYGEDADFYENSPTQYGGKRVINPFGRYANGINHVDLRGDRMSARQEYLDGQSEAVEELMNAAGEAAVPVVAGQSTAKGMNASIQANIMNGRKKNNR